MLSVCINYVDRGNLGVALKSIESEIHLEQDQLGKLLAAFFLSYSLMQILAGKIIRPLECELGIRDWVFPLVRRHGDHRPTRILFGLFWVCGFCWALANPSLIRLTRKSSPPLSPSNCAGTANAMIDAGSKVGPALGVLLGVKLVGWLSWRGMFFAIGAASLIWLIPWCLIVPRIPVRQLERNSALAPGLRRNSVKARRLGAPFWVCSAAITPGTCLLPGSRIISRQAGIIPTDGWR